MKIFNKIIGKANEISNKFKTSSKIVQISNQVYHCPYPTNPQILKSIINQLAPEQLEIWNLSEYKYPKQTFEALVQLNFKVNQMTFQFYSSMPLTTSIRSINKIDKFLKSSEKNIVFIHCQENKSRSVLFLAAYMYLTDQISDVATSLAFVNKKLGIEGYQTVYSSQHLILRNIANFHKDPEFINRQQLRLMKVIISEAPTLPEITNYQDESLMTLIQIRRNAKLIYRKTAKQFGQGEIVQFNLKEENIILADDCLFSFKYVFKQKIYPVMRIQLNTNFIFNNFLRVQMQEIDFCRNVKSKGHVFADFLFSTEKNKQSELSKINSKSITRSSLEPKEKAKRQNFSPKQSKQSKSQSKQKVKAIKIVEEQEKDMFHIHEQSNQQKRQDRDQLDQRQTQQKIRKLMDSMAKKQAEKQEDLKQIERQISKIEQHTKDQDLNLSSQKNQDVGIQRISPNVQMNENIQMKGDSHLDQQEDDLDDYLTKLTQQVDDDS